LQIVQHAVECLVPADADPVGFDLLEALVECLHFSGRKMPQRHGKENLVLFFDMLIEQRDVVGGMAREFFLK
jgi:hypothetical protein